MISRRLDESVPIPSTPALLKKINFLFIVGHCLGNYSLLKTLRLKCSPMVRKTGVQSQVESYQRFKKWYSMPPCLTLGFISYGSRVRWSNPGKGVAPSPTPQCRSY